MRKTLIPTTALKSFNRSARLFLLATIIYGVIFSAWQLFFNFFILARGLDKGFLGMVNSAPSMAALVFGIPLGMLSDRIGQRRAMLVGLGMASLALTAQLIVQAPALILVMGFIGGAGTSLFYISMAPFMMKVADAKNRTLLFSLNFGLQTISGSVGSLFAGQMPAFFSRLLNVAPQSAEAYQAVLLSAMILGSFCLVPIFLIREPRDEKNQAQVQPPKPVRQVLFQPVVIKLFIPNLLIGLGAAILIPYMNIFFSERFSVPDQTLGVLFSASALVMGFSSVLGPRLVHRLGSKIRAVVFSQSISLVFLLVLGFSPFAGIAALGFLMRNVLMNLAVPIFSAFSMEQVPERDRGTVNSLLTISWQAGWAVGPYISGVVQIHYGFNPLFIATGVLYALSIWLTWVFFRHRETRASDHADFNTGIAAFDRVDSSED